MAAGGEGERIADVLGAGVERPGAVGVGGDRGQGDGASVRGAESALGINQGVGAFLQQPRGVRTRLGEQRLDRAHQRGAAHVHGARAAVAAAGADLRRVGLDVTETIHRQAEPRRGDLAVRRLVAHAGGLGADHQGDGAVGIEAQLGGLVGLAARGFQIAGHAQAAQPAARGGGLPAGREAGAVGRGLGGIQVGGEAAAVDRGAEGVSIGERGDQVGAAQREGVAVQRARGGLDQALGEVVGFGLAGAAVGVDRHGVGQHAAHVHAHGGNVVRAAHRGGRRVGGGAGTEAGDIGAEIGGGGDIEGEEPALGIERQAGAGDVVASLRRGDEILGPLGDPLDRALQAAGGPEQQDVFRIDGILHAETTADVGGADAELLGGKVEESGQGIAQAVHGGAADDQVQTTGLRHGDGAAGLDRDDDQAGVHEIQRDRVRARGEGGVHRGAVAFLEPEGEVARGFVPQLRGVGGEGGDGVGHGGERVVAGPRSARRRRGRRWGFRRRRRRRDRRRGARGRRRARTAAARSSARRWRPARCRGAGRARRGRDRRR